MGYPGQRITAKENMISFSLLFILAYTFVDSFSSLISALVSVDSFVVFFSCHLNV